LIIHGPAFEGLSFDASIHRDKDKFNQSLGLVLSIAFKFVDYLQCVEQSVPFTASRKVMTTSYSTKALRRAMT
jgi:hypothetical protein